MHAIILPVQLTLLLLLLQRLRSQIIFQSGSFTTPTSIGNIGYNPNTNHYFYGTGNTGNNPWNNQFFYGNTGNSVSPYIQTNVCFCVTQGRCFSVAGNNGNGLFDIRIINTATGLSTGSVSQIAYPVSSGVNLVVQSQSYCQFNLELCCPQGGYVCGVRYSPFPNAPQPYGNQAAFGSYPWQAIILTSTNVYVGGGVLIDQLHILTVAHRILPVLQSRTPIKVRLGEWDASHNSEPIPFQEFNVARYFIHPQYSPTTLSNSIAILQLVAPVPLGEVPTISPACLSGTYVSNLRCWVAGWGASNFNSGIPSRAIEKEVDVPIINQATCQAMLQTTRLGPNFVLDTNSFMCAGGEAGKDACTGDGGSPLMCPIAGRWYVIGLVAWGVGCGTSNIPGVYMNVTNYIGWIQSVTASY